MIPNDTKITDHQINNKFNIITSDTNKELKQQIKDISQQVLKRNYDLYKVLENK